jgi:hypothetical protein
MKDFIKTLTNRTVLDVGAGEGTFPILMEKNIVTKIDIKTGQDIRTYPITPNSFEIVIARNVLPFLSDKKEILEAIEKMYHGSKEYCIFTLFGEKDPWNTPNSKMTFISPKDALFIREKYNVQEFHYFYGVGKTMYGEDKLWEIYSFIIKK